MYDNNALQLAASLISLTLLRHGLHVHKEPRGEETLLHVYSKGASVTAEANLFVRVQAHTDASAAQAAREADPMPSLYGKVTYLAQVIDDGAIVAVSDGLAELMLYTAKDIQELQRF